MVAIIINKIFWFGFFFRLHLLLILSQFPLPHPLLEIHHLNSLPPAPAKDLSLPSTTLPAFLLSHVQPASITSREDSPPFLPGHCDSQFSSVQSLSHVQLFATPWTTARQASLSITNSRSLPKLMSMSQWCHPTISSSVVPFSSCPQSFPESGSCQMSQLFASGGQSTGVSASTSVLPMNTQDRSPLGWTGWISLQSKGLSRVFSNTTVQKHQFFGTQLSL